jgi:energy-coupling factor transporter ATP-binding protein EcfA2
MMPAPSRRLPTNPFATRFTRPGVLPALGPHGEPIDAADLLSRIAPGRVVALVGPHGHGKSTLLTSLRVAARRTGSETTAVRIRSPSDSWRPVAAVLATPRRGLVVCDGWERALPGTGLVVRTVAAARGLRVVVTTHGPRGLPVLVHCETSPALLDELVARLPDHGGLITAADIDDAYRRHAGNVREALYDLYDRFERRARDRHRKAESPAIDIVAPR